MSAPATHLRKRPQRTDNRPGRDVCYWVVQRYLDDACSDLLAQEIYRTSAAVVEMNPDIFPNARAFSAFVDRVMKRGMGIKKPGRQHLRRVRVLKRVFAEPVRETAALHITRKTRKPYTRRAKPPPSTGKELASPLTQIEPCPSENGPQRGAVCADETKSCPSEQG